MRSEFLVGNLYINRSITGAIVGRHPFGGFKMSGGGTKAGGKDYLLNFMFPRVVTENYSPPRLRPRDAERLAFARIHNSVKLRRDVSSVFHHVVLEDAFADHPNLFQNSAGRAISKEMPRR